MALMRYRNQSVARATIGNDRDNDHRVDAFCPGCRRWAELDLLGLAARYGDDTAWSDLAPRLTCAVCGHRGAEIQCRPRRLPFSARWSPT